MRLVDKKLNNPKCLCSGTHAHITHTYKPFLRMPRIAKGPLLDGSRGFTARSAAKQRAEPPAFYDVHVNGQTCLRGTSFAAALIAVRGTAYQIQRSVEPRHKRITINGAEADFDALQPGEHTISVGAYTITIKHHVQLLEDEDDGELSCGCIDVCRSNCDGSRSARW